MRVQSEKPWDVAVFRVRNLDEWLYSGREAKRCGSIQGESQEVWQTLAVAVYRVRSQELWLYSG
jgi:hypothetical protein